MQHQSDDVTSIINRFTDAFSEAGGITEQEILWLIAASVIDCIENIIHVH